ncbi:glycosyltransferase family 2 protein [Parasediminibacterium sp. JCM 36343]|uniref:glycosyltransferase family 2 protein n=1 Tax=Parasediminibacterium sp. JCM 36343 TaxID=3374279 RepID=UPI00397D52FF
MLISIIIVNYNVKYFLEQCLCSVEKAIGSMEIEVIVVDNDSSDDSIAYLQPKFPFVKYIYNSDNVGFGKANNQALPYCKGDYILFLNPDTILPEDCFAKCIDFFEKQPDCGALGIKMIDGSGTFLPESKRGYPSPIASFFKLTGLAGIFPRSRIFNQYALGHLDPFANHKIDVLAGAFIMARKEAIAATNGFDEDFFMYGEDIDLSYRIQKAGFNNYYFSESTILHFKGESTKKGSLNYVKMFYSAMSIFVQKHYSGSKARVFSLLIQSAIFFRASISLLKSFVLKIGLPLVDALLIFCSLWGIKNEWTVFFRDGEPFSQGYFPLTFFSFAIIFLITGALSGMYDKLDKPSKTFSASISGIVVMIASYSLLPEHLRFSRAVVVFGGLAAAIAITIFRWVLLQLGWVLPSDEEYKFQQTAVIGSPEEYEHVHGIFKHAGLEERLLGRIKINGDDGEAIGDIKEVKQLLNTLNIRELIFCEGYLTYYHIIQMIQTLPHNISYRFIGHNTDSIVGSDSKATTGETLVAEGFYRISEPYNKRMKRALDIGFSSYLLITFPMQAFIVKKRWALFKNIFAVLNNQKTWVGYIILDMPLPPLKPNIITCYGLPLHKIHPLNKEALRHLNIQYAKNYDFWRDLGILLKNYKYLGG